MKRLSRSYLVRIVYTSVASNILELVLLAAFAEFLHPISLLKGLVLIDF